jgi:uncharacterized protein HemY
VDTPLDYPSRLQKLADFAGEIQTIDEAILILQQFLTLDPSDLEARHLLRSMEIADYEHNSKLDKTINALKIQTLLAKAASARDPARRIELAEEALALNPFHQRANEILASGALEAQLSKVAAFAYETLAHRYPEDKGILRKLSEIYITRQDVAEACAVLQEILELDPDDIEAQEKLVKLRRQSDARPPKEVTAAPAAADIPEDVPDRDALAAEIQDIADQIGSLKNQVREDPSLRDTNQQEIDSLRAHIEHLHQLDKLSECQRLRRICAEDPEDGNALFDLGEALIQAGLWQAAARAFDQAAVEPELREAAFVAQTLCAVQCAIARLGASPT